MPKEPTTILTLNIGSSSLKFALFRRDGEIETRAFSGKIDGIGSEKSRFRSQLEGATVEERTGRWGDHEAAIHAVEEALAAEKFRVPDAIGHRLVHGGAEHREHAAIDAPMLQSLRRAIPFAPLHLPAEIRGIETAMKLYPNAAQAACFDTSFHRDLPTLSRLFPLPRRFYDEGIARYGFHGLSYEYIVEKLGAELGGRAIVAHLGSGASMVALANGKPEETTMGLTPAGGFMSGTRTGDLDPGVLLHLARTGRTTDELERIVNHESGLLGISGTSSDMRSIEASRANDEEARLAFEMFCYHARKSIGALVAVLGGLDTLVFTGGIGEGSAAVRARICDGLECFGIRLDEAKNLAASARIGAEDATCQTRLVSTDEEIVIARHTRRIAETARRI